MDALVLLGSFAMLILIGMPVAYSLGLAALIGKAMRATVYVTSRSPAKLAWAAEHGWTGFDSAGRTSAGPGWCNSMATARTWSVPSWSAPT